MHLLLLGGLIWASPKPTQHGQILIPAGSFVQGAAHLPDAPRRTVTLSAFRIDQTEVSVRQMQEFARRFWADPRYWSAEGLAWAAGQRVENRMEAYVSGRSPEHPAVGVSFYEAEAYCRSMGGGLPTEAQWERAACGTGETRFPWGQMEEIVAGQPAANWYAGGKLGKIGKADTSPVEGSSQGPYGLSHVIGNVWEWTADSYQRDAWDGTPATDPPAETDGFYKTLRGGSFMDLPSYCTCQHREPRDPRATLLTVGFRCAFSEAL
jgi:formylglycine-generating enzyme required for sulfatase activity